MPNQYSPPRFCSVEGCNARHFCRGYCQKHYARWRRHGDPLKTAYPPFEERFWSKVDKSQDGTACWIWTASRTSGGYGLFNAEQEGHNSHYAHRIVHEMMIGPIPDGYEVDHLCRNPSCVNPEHLEAVTLRENRRRSHEHRRLEGNYFGKDKTRCKRGHPFDEKNTYIGPNGRRQCRICRSMHVQATKARKAERESMQPPVVPAANEMTGAQHGTA